jgi:hypothetical protein
LYHTFDVGERAWIFVGDQDHGSPKTTPGTVIAILRVQHLPYSLYVVQMDDADFLHCECRDSMLMSKSADALPPYANLGYRPKAVRGTTQ